MKKKSKPPSAPAAQLALALDLSVDACPPLPLAKTLALVPLVGEILRPSPRPEVKQSEVSSKLDERIYSRHERHSEKAQGALATSAYLCVFIILLKSGIPLEEANLILFKLPVESKQMIVGLLGYGAALCTLHAANHAVRAHLLRKEYPLQLVLKFERYKIAAMLANILYSMTYLVTLLMICSVLYFSYSEMVWLFYFMLSQLFATPWQTDIVPSR